MDLSNFDTTAAAQAGAKLELKAPNGDPLLQDDGAPVTITLLGRDSDVWRRAERAALDRRVNTRKKTVQSADLERDALEALVAVTVGWSGIVLDGNALDCTPPNVRRVYERFRWVREQVDEFVGDRANFLPASATN